MTAVELLFEEIDSIVKLSERKWEEVTRAFDRAKAMEKEQMLNAFQESRLTHPMIGFKHETFVDYFKQNFINPNDVAPKNEKTNLFIKGFDEALHQIKMTHLIIEAESKKELDEKLDNFIQQGWLLVGKTIFGYQQSSEDSSYRFIHSQMIFKPNKPE